MRADLQQLVTEAEARSLPILRIWDPDDDPMVGWLPFIVVERPIDDPDVQELIGTAIAAGLFVAALRAGDGDRTIIELPG